MAIIIMASIVIAAVAYICVVIYAIVSVVRKALRCRNCPYAFPGCKTETIFTSHSECAAERHLSDEDRRELRRKINELD